MLFYQVGFYLRITFLKLKPSQLLFILFVPLYHLPIRLLHIKHLYKVGDGNLLG